MKTIIPGHRYELSGEVPQIVQFVQKDISSEGTTKLETLVEGTTNEEVIEMLVDRIKTLNAKLPCRENSITITKLEEALMWQNKRTSDRQKRKVEGTNFH